MLTGPKTFVNTGSKEKAASGIAGENIYLFLWLPQAFGWILKLVLKFLPFDGFLVSNQISYEVLCLEFPKFHRDNLEPVFTNVLTKCVSEK